MKSGFWFLLTFYCLLFSCKSVYVPDSVNYSAYTVSADKNKDSLMLALMQPYRDSVYKSMSEIVAIADKALQKRKPEGSLGNFMADALLYMSRKKFNTQIDAAVINSGGIRIDEIGAGPITKGRIYELMPFDNLAVLIKVKGDKLQQFLNLIADNDGWPVAGISMHIKDKKATNILVNGKPLDMESYYTLALSDYLANGGDNATMLKGIPQTSIGYLVRDALFDYLKELHTANKTLTAKEDKRIINAQ